MNQLNMKFDGKTFEQKKDGKRLAAQYNNVFALMSDGKWRTLNEISEVVRAPEASISARLRDARKNRNGAHNVERRRVVESQGLWEYRLIVNKGER